MNSESLTTMLEQLVREHWIPGAQLAVRWHGRLITAEAGEETTGTGRLVTNQSAFPLGSLTKPFTATVAMMLVADGDLELDAPIATYLRELGSATTGTGRATLRQLLSHTSGLIANVEETAAGMARHRWVASCARTAVAHPPNTVFSYSNVGYLLVGHLIEVITGMSWRQAVESILLRPLGISPSFVMGPSARPFVDGHTALPNAVVPVTEQTVTALEEPVAALAASATDLVAFAEAHLRTQRVPGLLDHETTKEMRHDQLTGMAVDSFGLADSWGVGWSLYRSAGQEWFGHDGTGDGAWSHLRVEPANGTVIALVTNANNGVTVWEAVVERLRSSGLDVGNYSLPTLADPGPPVPGPAESVGRYVNGSETYTISADGGQLYLSADSEPRVELTCFQDLRFTTASRAGALPLVGRFLRDPATGGMDLLQATGRVACRSDTAVSP
jgi:CubicO group peptidase (beta-lactamase class C family)